MIPYRGPFATAVPRNPEVRHEILKAAQTLADEDDPARRRGREIASIRAELQVIREDVAELRRDTQSLVLRELRKHGYNPDEPRIPRYHVGGGEWTRVAANDDPNETSDDSWFPRQPYGEGHHWVPKTIYKDREFSEETKKAFDNAKSGALANPLSVHFNNS
jgi:hypothetical protein